eukprot:TRINITY_DN34360_c0_g1_i1.p1 TRINITY_DN34360_c0_g1~~TRINITY_DN34360_c0_g1_i1.p1  ORF type:complete len:170 (-),score=36.32 TRINITY_DN34360_c0_g1_i1:140-649(-)
MAPVFYSLAGSQLPIDVMAAQNVAHVCQQVAETLPVRRECVKILQGARTLEENMPLSEEGDLTVLIDAAPWNFRSWAATCYPAGVHSHAGRDVLRIEMDMHQGVTIHYTDGSSMSDLEAGGVKQVMQIVERLGFVPHLVDEDGVQEWVPPEVAADPGWRKYYECLECLL